MRSSLAFERLIYDEDLEFYELTFDDSRIPAAQMREAAWLSPYVAFAYNLATPFEMARSASRRPDGTYVVNKVLLAPWLELCVAIPPAKCERDEEVPDAAFLRNAANSLQRGEEQLDRPLHMRLPEVLEPVRAYLLEHLLLSFEREKIRYEYLKSGDVTPMRKLLCTACECGAPDEALLTELQTTADPRSRHKVARFGWSNRVRCSSA